MNETKKLTQGAMLLAIIGALILIDRMSAFLFTELLVLLMPVVIIMYSAMHEVKDGLVLSVGLIILSFLLGNFNFTYMIYVPVGILTGIVYSLGLKRGLDKRSLLFLAILVYVAGEIIATFVIYPLLGFPLSKMIEEYKLATNQVNLISGMNLESIYKSMGFDFSKVIVVSYILATIFVGVMEGVLIHLLAVLLLKKFKIKDLGNINIFDMKPNKYVAYICMLCLFLTFFIKDIKNEALYYICITLIILSAMVLAYYGYLFVVLYGIIVLKRNIGSFFVLLSFVIPVLLALLVVLGFLYGAGPLRTYLEKKMGR